MPGEDFGIGITGLGKGLPARKVTSQELAGKVGKTAAWIIEKTGIESRHYVSGSESASGLSAGAARQALERAGVKAEEVNLILGCTFSGDYVMPAMACRLQALLGAGKAMAFDISASSSGFLAALGAARDRLRCDPETKHILIAAAAVQSPYLDWEKPEVSVIFGDGAAAALVSRVPKGYGLLATESFCDGRAFEALRLRGGGSSFPLRPENAGGKLQYIEMDGLSVGRAYLKYLPEVMTGALKKSGLAMEDVDLFLFHQANLRMIEILMKRMNLPMSKTHTNVERFGNIGDASLALALCEAAEAGRIRGGQTILLASVGAGCTFTAALLRWQ